ncbi:exo-rhamnogalacturonan lyase family protein [Kribbella deserti]|uniref:Twin-arginine translocation signal domain-containing protein n=1 Tax=Kribbella deserti TaxID=1926257 RepID=A0ABV6QHP6_9ACTN
MSDLTRRTFLGGVAAAGVAYGLPSTADAATAGTAATGFAAGPPPPAELRWLEGGRPKVHAGTTWGVPWPRGTVPKGQTFALTTAAGEPVPVQTWATGYWPDGSLKWTAHAVSPDSPVAEQYRLEPGPAAVPAKPIKVTERGQHVIVNTGAIEVTVRKSGADLIEKITRDGRTTVKRGQLVALRQNAAEDDDTGVVRRDKFVSQVRNVIIEQRGPIRAVLRLDGMHRAVGHGHREWLPFTVRFYFSAGSDAVRMTHTFVWDGTADDYLRGLGIRFEVPMQDELYDRHIRFGGEEGGLLREAVRGITGLRRDPGAAVRTAQVAGQRLPDPATWDQRVTRRLPLIPAWGDYSLSQLTADGYSIRKRTKPGHTWVDVDSGQRAPGLAYVGGVSGGLAVGLRNFWQLHPTQLDIRGAADEKAEVTVWLWSPDARPMDLRFYHDGLGMDTFPEQLEGLEITYEDYEPGFGTAYGVARTSELTLWAVGATPANATLAAMAEAVQTPPLLAAAPKHLLDAGVFGDWSLVDRSTPAKTKIEDRLDFLFDYYQGQIEQRRWYGFWNYGDVMHTYDNDRHQWRYDIGGYAWDNSELSTDLWLWYAYLRSGRSDIFRVAEAMTRHTGEVDVYHLGQWKDLGTRHNVLHWGCSAKQLRISTAANRRFYYFLTADERVGDLLHELVDSDKTFLALDPLRKIRTEPYVPDRKALAVGLGTDWGSLAAAWLTEWERGGDPIAREKLLGTVQDISALKNGFLTGGALYNLDTGRFATDGVGISVSHLSAVFGLVEICSELVDLLDDPKFEKAWVQYCRLYGATQAEQTAEVGSSWNRGFRQMHSRCTAYAAVRTGNDALAQRAWKEFFDGESGYGPTTPWTKSRLTGAEVLRPVDEAAFVSTNATAQYGLAAIQNLALVGDKLGEGR